MHPLICTGSTLLQTGYGNLAIKKLCFTTHGNYSRYCGIVILLILLIHKTHSLAIWLVSLPVKKLVNYKHNQD